MRQGTTAGTQNRYFTYDGRGFLTSETHPEKGASGNGSVTYSRYDARGNAGRKVDGPFSLDSTYDKAGRLVEVRQTSGNVLKSFTYGTGYTASDRSRGKLQVAKRYQHPVLGGTTYTTEVRETYTYAGRQGRVSKRTTQNLINGAQSDQFSQTWSYDELGSVTSLTYPNTDCWSCGGYSPRTVSFGYSRGMLTSVSGYATSITYHPNGMMKQVVHTNGVTDIQNQDPYHVRRPAGITCTGAVPNWTTGVYSYDGVGNITKMGSSQFLYDGVSRLKDAGVYTGVAGGGTRVDQSYTYDGFGNLTAMSGTVGRSVPVSPATNRLSGAVLYDAAGNLTYWNGASYEVDAFGNMTRMASGGQEFLYFYTADDERLWAYQVAGGESNRWTFRDLDGKVLRESVYDRPSATWHVERDYLYRDGQLLAAATPQGTRHFHLDHLGTPRLITDAAGTQLAYHTYYPYGEEATAFNQDTERLKFTRHERDLASPYGASDDLDYMHARFYNPQLGRFLSVDPANSAIATKPQSWNRYSYGRGNPVRFIDPDGRQETEAVKVPEESGLVGAFRSMMRRLKGSLIASGRLFMVEGETGQQLSKVDEMMSAAADVAAVTSVIRPSDLPSDADKALREIETGEARPNVVKSEPFENDGRGGTKQLPTHDKEGNPIKYTEHTVNPREPGQRRDGKRIVIGSDGSVYYTEDHYQSFHRVKRESAKE